MEEREQLESQIRERLKRGDLPGAATAALRGYGSEVFGFLVALHRDETAAEEVFSDVTERIWKGLPSFEARSSFRTWMYTIARNASRTHHRNTRRRARRQAAFPEGSELSRIAEKIRSETLAYLKTEKQSRAAKLRESLSREDQELLMLRVDRRLAWNDLVQVLHDGEDPLDPAEMKREASRLRKRFQVMKERLMELGRREGLVGGELGE